ncbi:hypothetical protein HDA32_003438 [Spinactinospora alkalitolerans]|uniref:DUF397 domain-containing protein n=1 Tax=Spinactinospora alkalitolerans TaxID=687207 RepID=A0A852TWL4_9ACTN|nr:DUF397 domain-containing protein [Spinactinospora alkalitolerans]NYE48318.1 hypothetical protein [Spinactinospora alkalitolerans]
MSEEWYKSSYSKASGECVEAAQLVSGVCGIRDSKAPAQAPLLFSVSEWHAFISSVKAGHLAG